MINKENICTHNLISIGRYNSSTQVPITRFHDSKISARFQPLRQHHRKRRINFSSPAFCTTHMTSRSYGLTCVPYIYSFLLSLDFLFRLRRRGRDLITINQIYRGPREYLTCKARIGQPPADSARYTRPGDAFLANIAGSRVNMIL